MVSMEEQKEQGKKETNSSKGRGEEVVSKGREEEVVSGRGKEKEAEVNEVRPGVSKQGKDKKVKTLH